MATSSKILTVTYGTFSCTLEGFDDPFTTLQMVAEYFRRLAAEDRHFGSVPSMPDTETLKRIAEENARHGVAAEIGDNGITLRKADAPAPGAAAMPVFDSQRNEDSEDGDAAGEAGLPLTFHSKRGAVPADPAEAVAGEGGATGEDAEAGKDAEAGSAGASDTQDTVGLAVAGAAGAAAAAEEARQAAVPKSVEETLAEIRRNVRQAESDISGGAAEDEDGTPEPAPPQAGEGSDPQPEPLILTDEIAEEETPEPAAAPVASAGAEEAGEPVEETGEPESLPESLELEEAPETAEEPAGSAETLPEAAPEAAETPAAEAAGEEPAEAAAPETAAEEAAAEASPEAPAEYVPPADSSLTPEEEEELARDLAAAIALDDTPQPARFDGDAVAGDDEEAAEGIAGQAEEAEQGGVAARRRRADALRALAAGEDGGEDGGEVVVDRLLEATRSKMDRPEQQRRLNALEQLKAAVAATEAERQVTGRKPEDRDADQATDLAAYREDLRRARSGSLNGDAAIGRAEEAAEAPADSTPEPAPEPAAEDSPAPAPRPAATAAPAAPAPPPLILVSEQRIDEPDGTGEAPGQPGREVAQSEGNLALKPEAMPLADAEPDSDEIQGIPADAFSEATSFSDFAERIGAFELTDLLEAAAAYTSIVEGRPRFSRAQVMSKVARLNHGDGYSKEAGLRSFGKLLREGKILRVQDGQFGISKASRFSIATRFQE